MTRTVLALSLVLAPALGAAQSASAPLITTATSAKAVGAAEVKIPISKPNDGGPSSPTAVAQQTLNAAKNGCSLLTREEKLYAACDNSTPEGRTRLPRTRPEWEAFAKRLQGADAVVKGKRRGVVVLNGSETMAEITSAGLLVPRK